MLLPFIVIFSASSEPTDSALFMTVVAQSVEDAATLASRQLIQAGHPTAQILGVWNEDHYAELATLFDRARKVASDSSVV